MPPKHQIWLFLKKNELFYVKDYPKTTLCDYRINDMLYPITVLQYITFEKASVWTPVMTDGKSDIDVFAQKYSFLAWNTYITRYYSTHFGIGMSKGCVC